jgi:hypothetical protein
MNSDLERLHRAIAYSLRGLDAEGTQLRPVGRPGRWSIQQVVEHLLLTYSATEMAMDTRLEKGNPTRAKPNPLQHFVQFTLVRLGYFPRGRKAPAMVMPGETETPLSGDELVRAMDEHLERLDGLFTEGEKAFGAGRSVSHVVLGPMSMAQWRRFHLIHGEHHVRQILAIRKAHRV